ncbi:MAG: DNA sulfur modification protein DndD [Spirulinaceae cyanobacterium]
MRFCELVLQNFGPYKGRNVLNFQLPVEEEDTSPIILLGGMNGGGKTTLMDAIRLAFYGSRAQCSTRGNLSYGDFLTQSVHKLAKATEEACIELAFEHIYNSQQAVFRIRRSWLRNPRNGKDTLSIAVDKWFDDALTKTWDERIEDIFPLGISNLFLFDGEQVKELAELETPPAIVIEAIQSLLGLELAEKLSVDLDILVNRKRKTLATAKQRLNIEGIEKKIKQQKDSLAIAKRELTELQTKLAGAQERQQIATSNFIVEGGKIAAKRSQLEAGITQLTIEKEEQYQSLKDVAGDVLPLGLIIPLLTATHQQGEVEVKREQAQIAREVLIERDEHLLEYIQSISLAKIKLKQIEAFLAAENQSLATEIEAEEDAYLKCGSEAIKQLNQLLETELPRQITITQEKLEKLQQIEVEINSQERQLAMAAPPEAYEKLEKALEKAQQELGKVQAEYEVSRKNCGEIERRIIETKKELQKYGEEHIDRSNDEHIIKSAAKVQQTLQLFRDKLTLKKLNRLEVEVTECFRYLIHKEDFVHRITIDSESFRLSLYDFQGESLPKHRLSAGEKQLLAIAFLWGLARVSGRNLPVAIDTPLGRLDSEHRHNLVERYFPAASHQVILLSTDTEIGKTEIEQLRKSEAIALEYLLKYNHKNQQTTIEEGYFW